VKKPPASSQLTSTFTAIAGQAGTRAENDQLRADAVVNRRLDMLHWRSVDEDLPRSCRRYRKLFEGLRKSRDKEDNQLAEVMCERDPS